MAKSGVSARRGKGHVSCFAYQLTKPWSLSPTQTSQSYMAVQRPLCEEYPMALSLIRGKYVICKIRSRTAADVIEDGAVVQRDGTILAVGPYAALAQQYHPDETFGSAEHVAMPGL